MLHANAKTLHGCHNISFLRKYFKFARTANVFRARNILWEALIPLLHCLQQWFVRAMPHCQNWECVTVSLLDFHYHKMLHWFMRAMPHCQNWECVMVSLLNFHYHKMLSYLPWFIIVSRPQLHFVQVFEVAAVRAGAWWYSHNTSLTQTLSMLTASSVQWMNHEFISIIQYI